MLKVIQPSGKHCSCHLQGLYILVGRFLQQPYIEQAAKNAEPIHIHPEDGNYNVCRNVG
jgi:hypothetical protein